MKFNWGTGLIIFFVLFVGTLAFILYQSRQYDNSLVIDNYYDEDIRYQEHYDKKQNTADLITKVQMSYNKASKEITLIFPVDSVSTTSGKVLLYNPSTNKSDVSYDFNLGVNSTYTIPVDKINAGRWKLKIDWKCGEKLFYQEEEIII